MDVKICGKLQIKILPLYYNNRPRWIRMMKLAISINASYSTRKRSSEYCDLWNSFQRSLDMIAYKNFTLKVLHIAQSAPACEKAGSAM